MRIQTICGQFASKMADCSPSGHSSRSSCEQGGDGETVEQGSFAQRWGGRRLERAATLLRVRLLHENDRLLQLERRADLTQAILGGWGRGRVRLRAWVAEGQVAGRVGCGGTLLRR